MLEIHVVGDLRSGKSAVGQLIKDQLTVHGITAVLEDTVFDGVLDEDPQRLEETYFSRLASIAKSMKDEPVIIKTRQVVK